MSQGGFGMFQNAFIFTVSENTFKTHQKYNFCAIGNSKEPIESFDVLEQGNIKYKQYEILSNILNVRDGDLIFFYVERVGFKGIYKVKQSPFFDATEIEGVPASRPFRVFMECLYNFEKPVPENALFSTPERQRIFWLWYHNKIRRTGRGCSPLDPDARDELIRLLIRFNGGQESEKGFITSDYPNSNRVQEIRSFKVKQDKKLKYIQYEFALEAMVMRSLREKSSTLTPVFGEFDNQEWFANQIPYHISGKTIDLMLYHRSKSFLDVDTRYQCTIAELKKDTATIDAAKQLYEYCSWAGDQIFKGDLHLVQPAIIAHDFDDELLAITESKLNTINPTFKPLKLIQYSYEPSYGLILQEVRQRKERSEELTSRVKRKYINKKRSKTDRPLRVTSSFSSL